MGKIQDATAGSPLEVKNNIAFDKHNKRPEELNKPIRLGYFHGGRIHLLYRSYINKEFEKEGVGITFYTRTTYENEWIEVPKDNDGVEKINRESMRIHNTSERIFGRATGLEIIDALEKGLLDGGTVGEGSFISAVSRGSPIVAVAFLGHGSKEKSTRAIMVRSDVVIKSPLDFKGKRIIAPQAGPSDLMCVKKFVEEIGLDPQKDVIIIAQVPADKISEYFRMKKAEVAFGHMHKARQMEENKEAYLYQGMGDWMRSELSFALLVFRKDFLEKHPGNIKKIIRVIMKRIKYENSLSKKEQFKNDRFGLQMKLEYKNLTLPIFEYPPFIKLDLLNEVQEIMFEYKDIDKKVDFKDFVNNVFIKKVYEELK
jgi:sulfonate transport system substrate-binding protein